MKKLSLTTVMLLLALVAAVAGLTSGIAIAEEAAVPVAAAAPAAVPAPLKIETGDTAWMIVATALVMLMIVYFLIIYL